MCSGFSLNVHTFEPNLFAYIKIDWSYKLKLVIYICILYIYKKKKSQTF